MISIEEMIRQHIVDNILFSDNGYLYSDDDSFLENQILDSINIMELVLFVEEEFGIFIDDNEIIRDNFDSINKLSCFTRCKMDPVSKAIDEH
jgi:acyl carrier protein